MNMIIKDKSIFDKQAAKKKFNRWMCYDFGAAPVQEWQYCNIKKKIIAEKYIETETGDLPDYKVYCFNGKPMYIQIICGRFGNVTKHVFLNTNWEPMEFSYPGYEVLEDVPEKPVLLDEMVHLSEKISQPFAFVRVDWYIVGGNKLYFGEMTFTPASGVRHWEPEGTDKRLGDLIRLPETKYLEA